MADIRKMTVEDLLPASHIHQQNFVRQNDSQLWLKCHILSYPRDFTYVIETEKQVVGYIIWTQKSGFRQQVVLELSQIAIDKDFQHQGYATQLILVSLKQVILYLNDHDQQLDKLYISTGANNNAKSLYTKLFQPEIEATFHHLYNQNDDEIILIVRSFDNFN